MLRQLTRKLTESYERKHRIFVTALAAAIIAAMFIIPTTAISADTEETAIIDIINKYRAQNGLGKLTFSETLYKAAKGHSADMASRNYFSHESLNGANFSDRIKAAGYSTNTYLGENIAAGMTKASEAFDAWRKSPGHNSIMLGKNFKAVGIARVYNANSEYGWYWTADFGGYADSTASSAAASSNSKSPTGDTTYSKPNRSSSNNSEWGAESLNWLLKNKGLKGYPDGCIRPNNQVTRAEFATMVVKAFEIRPVGRTTFKDTKTHWGRLKIASLADRGILKGFVDGSFRPNKPITRAEMTQAITKAAGLKLASSNRVEFSDIAGHWARNTIIVAASNNIVNGYAGGKFKPDAKSTRAEAATILYRLNN
ncbi:MAG: S-layer homology domain-containing protein [Rubrobacteridae bacterium]|nr:S-layer homology domain-containing protein [Rubrobacteridae bacterium]